VPRLVRLHQASRLTRCPPPTRSIRTARNVTGHPTPSLTPCCHAAGDLYYLTTSFTIPQGRTTQVHPTGREHPRPTEQRSEPRKTPQPAGSGAAPGLAYRCCFPSRRHDPGTPEVAVCEAQVHPRASKVFSPDARGACATERRRSLAGPAARNMMLRKAVMSARSSATLWFAGDTHNNNTSVT